MKTQDTNVVYNGTLDETSSFIAFAKCLSITTCTICMVFLQGN